jgi:hypothetical protein
LVDPLTHQLGEAGTACVHHSDGVSDVDQFAVNDVERRGLHDGRVETLCQMARRRVVVSKS